MLCLRSLASIAGCLFAMKKSERARFDVVADDRRHTARRGNRWDQVFQMHENKGQCRRWVWVAQPQVVHLGAKTHAAGPP